jgi:hypothetical protein
MYLAIEAALRVRPQLEQSDQFARTGVHALDPSILAARTGSLTEQRPTDSLIVV